MLRTSPLPITATILPPTPLPPDNSISAVVRYPAPGLVMITPVILPALLTSTVIVACTKQSPVTVAIGGSV